MINRVNCWKAKGVCQAPMPISSQAMGSAISTMEGSEVRSESSASNKPIHERPAPHIEGDDMIRHSVKAEIEFKRLVELKARSLTGVNGNCPLHLKGCRITG